MSLICFRPQPQEPVRRRRIDRSMIGEPTNFVHTGHVGSGDVSSNGATEKVSTMQEQLKSKGGYDVQLPVNVRLSLIDVQSTR
ncbi:CDC42SE2 [Bugula neritina]|uniref:CDC42SE2 n=1 Tax=Bugula neritina TaxID=10212 RepID=A0A7J7J9P7_BUGNE|nr:CDC42SE2 [Bugula neritina]KAF6023724.1 CDC42SE2 [Bugula neritina]